MSPKQVLTDWLRAMEARDPQRILDLLADNIEIRAGELEHSISGKKTLSGLVATMPNVYESFAFDIDTILESGAEAAALVRAKGKLRSDITLSGETLKTAGKAFTISGAVFIRVNAAGKIELVSRIRDNMEIMRQLGITPKQMESMLHKLDQELAA
jgi:hypothetical protein